MNIIKCHDGDEAYLVIGKNPTDYPNGQFVELHDPWVTTQRLVDAWTNDLEGANHHGMTNRPQQLVDAMRFTQIEEEKIRRVLLSIVLLQDEWI